MIYNVQSQRSQIGVVRLAFQDDKIKWNYLCMCVSAFMDGYNVCLVEPIFYFRNKFQK